MVYWYVIDFSVYDDWYPLGPQSSMTPLDDLPIGTAGKAYLETTYIPNMVNGSWPLRLASTSMTESGGRAFSVDINFNDFWTEATPFVFIDYLFDRLGSGTEVAIRFYQKGQGEYADRRGQEFRNGLKQKLPVALDNLKSILNCTRRTPSVLV